MKFFVEEKVYNFDKYYEIIYCTQLCNYCSYYLKCRPSIYSYSLRLAEITYKK